MCGGTLKYYGRQVRVCSSCDDEAKRGLTPKWFQCKKCEDYFRYTTIKPDHCLACYASSNLESKGERSLKAFIEELGFATEKKRNGVECDVWVPEKDIGFEYNGEYWHSESCGKKPDYHFKKKALFDNKIYFVWDHGWKNHPEPYKQLIRAKLGVLPKTYARSLVLNKNPDKDDVRQFLQYNHIQGAGRHHKIGYALEDRNGAIISVMTFGRPMHKSTGDFELYRYASKMQVLGGAQRLWSAFCRDNPGVKVHTSCSADISNGALYERLGFTRLGHSNEYHWFKQNQKVNRFKCRVSELAKNADWQEGDTENTYMNRNGWVKVWSAGNYSYTITTPKIEN
jgi:hypothetical protein